jgi:hypothetical protein
MSHMSYVMFENTLRDLQACSEKMDEIDGDWSQLSESERLAAGNLIELCCYIAEEFE